MKNKVVLLAIFLVMIISVSAFAQVGKFGIGAHMTLGNSAIDEEDADYFTGLHARARLSPGFALDGSMEFRKDLLEDGTEVTLRPLQVSGLFYLVPNSVLSIYALGGVGWSTMAFNLDRSELPEGEEVIEEENKLSYHIGAGLEVPFSQQISVYGEVRYLALDFEKLKELLKRDIDSSGLQYNFGVTLYF